MTDLVSRVYRPDPAKCCEACAFGRGRHETWCASHPDWPAAQREKYAAEAARKDREQRSRDRINAGAVALQADVLHELYMQKSMYAVKAQLAQLRQQYSANTSQDAEKSEGREGKETPHSS